MTCDILHQKTIQREKLMFDEFNKIKVGDLVTGMDRSYERSIYEVVQIEDNMIFATLFSFGGLKEDSPSFRNFSQTAKPIGEVKEFRHALEEEIKISLSGPVVWEKRKKWLAENYGIKFKR